MNKEKIIKYLPFIVELLLISIPQLLIIIGIANENNYFIYISYLISLICFIKYIKKNNYKFMIFCLLYFIIFHITLYIAKYYKIVWPFGILFLGGILNYFFMTPKSIYIRTWGVFIYIFTCAFFIFISIKKFIEFIL